MTDHFDLDAALKAKGSSDHFDLDAALNNGDATNPTAPILSQGNKPSTISALNPFESELRTFNPTLPGGLQGEGVKLPSNRTIAQQLPTVGAMAATAFLGPGAGALVRMAAAGLGGAAGSAAEQTAERLSSAPPSPSMFGENPVARALGAGAEQGLFEGALAGVKKLGAAAKSRYLPDTPEFRRGEARSATMEKKLKPQEISPILSGKEKKLKELEDIARKEVESKFGPTITPTNAGRALADINATASKVAHELSSANYTPTNKLTVDLAPYSDLLATIDAKYLPPALKRGLHRVTKAKAKMEEPETVMKLAKSVVSGDSQLRAMSFPELQELRTALRTAAEPSNAVMADTTSAQLNRLANQVTDILDTTAEKAGVGPQWKAADAFHRSVGDIFDRGIGKEIAKTGVTDPQRIVGLIKPHDVKAVEDIHKIFDFASQGGKEAAQKATAARQAFERAFLDEKILNHPVGKWQGQIDAVGKDVYDLVLQKDPAAATNLHDIAGVMKRLAPDGDIPADAAALLAMQTGVVPGSFGTHKNILQNLTIWAMPNVHKTRTYVNALQLLGSKQSGNALRGAKVIGALVSEMEKEKPPALPSTMPPPPKP